MTLPQERLNQIAQRKLSALGVGHRPGPDGTIEGELPLPSGRVSHPSTGAPLTRAPFRTHGHDHLRFTEGPFSGLPPVLFYDVEALDALQARVLHLLQQRVSQLRDLDGKLKTLGLVPSLDVNALRLRSSVKGSERSYELLAGPEGLKVARVVPLVGPPFAPPESFPAIPIKDFTTSAELELFLEGARELRDPPAHPPPSAAASAPSARTLKLLPPPANALLLSSLTKLAQEGVVLASAELSQELEADGKRYRFSLSHESGNTFSGRLVGPTGEKWKDRIDLTRFPGIAPFVRTLLGLGAEPQSTAASRAPTQEMPAVSHGAPSAPGRSQTIPGLPAHLVPQAGEIWVMNVLVERDDGQEIRYVCTNIDGHPYGAARILKKSDFVAVFTPQGTGWRLRIKITNLEPDGVSYFQITPNGETSGTLKKIPPNTFAANFLPEAADY